MKKPCKQCLRLIAVLAAVLCLCCSAYAQNGAIVQAAPVAKFSGSWYEIGRQIGLTYPESIVSFGLTMQTVLMFAGPGQGWTPQAFYAEIEGLLPQSIRDHLEGMAAGLAEARYMSHETAWNIVVTQNVATDLLNMDSMSSVPRPSARDFFGCTGFAVSSGAGTFLCHNTDAPSTGGDDINVLMYWQPDSGENGFITMDPPGWADVAYAVNDRGIGVTMNAGNPNTDARIGLPVNCMIRTVMEHASSLEEAVGYFRTFLDQGNSFSTGGALVHLVDFNTSGMAKLQVRSRALEVTYGEESPHGVTFIGSANHFTGDFNPDPDYYYESSFERHERLMQLLGGTETFDLDACWSVLSDTLDGEGGSNCISRTGGSSGTAFGTVFTADGVYYTIGPPHEYLARYGTPQYVALDSAAAMNLATFTASPESGAVTLSWTVDDESDIASFDLYRAPSQTGPFEKITASPVAVHDAGGGAYVYEDTGLQNRNRYFYRLEINGTGGAPALQPCTVSATPRLIYAAAGR